MLSHGLVLTEEVRVVVVFVVLWREVSREVVLGAGLQRLLSLNYEPLPIFLFKESNWWVQEHQRKQLVTSWRATSLVVSLSIAWVAVVLVDCVGWCITST